MTEIEISHSVVIRSLHSTVNASFSEAENREIYGSCVQPHGHDYRVRVTLRGPVDPDSGWVFERNRIGRILSSAVIAPFDGANLNELFPNTTGEGLARAIYLRLAPLFPEGLLIRVQIEESAKTHFFFPPF